MSANFSAPAELSPCSTRGSLHEPQTVSGAESKSFHRVLSVKLSRVGDDEWKLLRDAASQSARYANSIVSSLMAEFCGYRAPEGAKNLSVYIRGRCKGELSGAAYSAIEREVQAEFKKNRKHIWAGTARPPFYSADRALSIRKDGVRVMQSDKGFAIRLVILAAAHYPPFMLEIEKNTRNDDFVSPLLQQFAAGCGPTSCRLVFDPMHRSIHARLGYEVTIAVAAVGERTATLEFNRDGRFLLRADHIPAEDLTHRVTQMRSMKLHFEGIRKRILRRGFGRGKGDARRRRKHLVRLGSFDAWAKEYLHKFSLDILRWCQQGGVGYLSILDVGDGDWPAYRLKQYLAYKGELFGVALVDGAKGESAERTIGAEIKRQHKKAARIRKSVRVIQTAINGGKAYGDE